MAANPTDTLYKNDGATLTISGVSDPIDLGHHDHVWLTCYAKGAVSGTNTPKLVITWEQQDGLGNYLTTKQLADITAQFGFDTKGIGGGANEIPLVGTGRIRWTLTGTNPQFLDVDITLVGR